MNGGSNPFLNDVLKGYNQPSPVPSPLGGDAYAQMMAPPPAPAAPPYVPPPAPPQTFAAQAGQSMSAAPPMSSQAPPPKPMAQAPAAPQDAPYADPLTMQWRPVAMGGTPAREAKVIGPQAEKIQLHNENTQRDLAGEIRDRSQSFQNQAAIAATVDVDRAKSYEDAAQQRVAQHNAQLESSRQEYVRSVDDLSKAAQIDPNRIFARPDTRGKIAASMLVGALNGLANSTENKVIDSIQRDQDLDIMAQKDAYARGLDQAKGKQTAFGMLMDRYQNEGAAEAALRTAMLDRQITEARMQKAQAGSVDEANNYDKFIQGLTDKRDAQREAGLRFVPATTGGVMYQASQGGHVVPGLFSAKEARDADLKLGVEERQKGAHEDAKGMVDITKAQIEHSGKGDKQAAEDARHISQQIVTQGIPQARAAAEEAMKSINEHPRGNAERAVRATVPGLAPHVLSDESNGREQAYQNFMNQSMKALMGNVTASEEVRAARVYGGNDVARKKSIDLTLKQLDEQEKAIKGGANLGSQQSYAQQVAGAVAGQPLAPSSAQPGHK